MQRGYSSHKDGVQKRLRLNGDRVRPGRAQEHSGAAKQGGSTKLDPLGDVINRKVAVDRRRHGHRLQLDRSAVAGHE